MSHSATVGEALLIWVSRYSIGLPGRPMKREYAGVPQASSERANNHGHQPDCRERPAGRSLRPPDGLYIERNEYITYFELRRITIRAEDDFELEYVRRGERQRVALAEGVCDDPQLKEPNPWLAEKLLIFRPVSMGEAQQCFH